ncbi:hypothetical protein HPB49_002258 [Dermacentor silvarum]|uniref:Uncharacterized protein n=1 Tax=Dermacentor silvarum TaxID=543639 RepID=A0ACB8DI90_DERSI|nr:hypothetical protein HPB49_002258 [Dermacentor silvarum]
MSTKRSSRASDGTSKVARKSTSAVLISEMASRLASELAGLFRCVACGECVRPPILQCSQGHLICVSCREKDDTCPECLAPIGDTRVPSMERVAAILFTPCRHSVHGCRAQLTFSDQWEHEDTCEFSTCRGYHNHMAMAEGMQLVTTQSCLGRNFLLVFWREHEDASKGCCVLAQLIGEPREADKFTYRVEVTRDGVRSLTWKDRPRSLHESIESAIASRDCLFFDARQFAEGGKLNVEFTVYACTSDVIA